MGGYGWSGWASFTSVFAMFMFICIFVVYICFYLCLCLCLDMFRLCLCSYVHSFRLGCVLGCLSVISCSRIVLSSMCACFHVCQSRILFTSPKLSKTHSASNKKGSLGC